jgi:hypothetical protein
MHEHILSVRVLALTVGELSLSKHPDYDWAWPRRVLDRILGGSLPEYIHLN